MTPVDWLRAIGATVFVVIVLLGFLALCVGDDERTGRP